MNENINACKVINASSEAVNCIRFNKIRHAYLASGDCLGTVKIWKLSPDLLLMNDNENKILENIAEKPFEK
jgi:hypothetical protein